MALRIFFSAALFLSSFLLFLIQPLIAKALLPTLGGSAQVWTSCVLFFQLLLLAGYLYANQLSKISSSIKRLVIHLFFLGTALIAVKGLSSFLYTLPSESESPLFWIFKTLWELIGLPFFLLSASTPLFQFWFSKLKHPDSHNPYFLSVAGNLGSLAGLLAYPLFLEPNWTLHQQMAMWSRGFTYFSLISILLAVISQFFSNAKSSTSLKLEAPSDEPPLTSWMKLKWLIYSFVPCSLMLSMTTHLSTDVAPIPLIWVITLAIYLLTFALAFESRFASVFSVTQNRFLLFFIPTLLIYTLKTGASFFIITTALCSFLFIACLFFHSKLFSLRPASDHLTSFYVYVSTGGILAGIFNGILGPACFPNIWEYPITLFAAAALWVTEPQPKKQTRGRPDPLLGAGILLIGLLIGSSIMSEDYFSGMSIKFLLRFPLLLLVILFRKNPKLFLSALAILLILKSSSWSRHETLISQGRSFYGIHQILFDKKNKIMSYKHGSTIHGAQSLSPSLQAIPQTYYHPLGPITPIMNYFRSLETSRNVAVIGLGTGSMAAYAEGSEDWSFFEIDSHVARIAKNPNFFTYLEKSSAPVKIILGDGRLSLTQVPDGTYGLMIFDAFSSDSIPIHFLTREALALFRRKLAPRGVLAFHISNRFLDLRPVLSALADEASWQCFYQAGPFLKQMPEAELISDSVWVVMIPRKQSNRTLMMDSFWRIPSIPLDPKFKWTDDYSNIWAVIKKPEGRR